MSSARKPHPILIVDDDESALGYLGALIGREGFDILTAPSAQKAFELLDQRAQSHGDINISLIICDWKMPGWDGIKFLHEIRFTQKCQVPFLLMSGAVTREELVEAGKNLANGVLVKPIKREILLDKIKSILNTD